MEAIKIPKGFTGLIFASLALGVLVGCALNAFAPAPVREGIAGPMGMIAHIFLNLVKMVVAPLIFATLTSGIAGLGDGSAVARITIKAMLWFLVASLVSLAIGAGMALLLQPGAGAAFPSAMTGAAVDTSHKLTVEGVIVGAFPTSIVDALATNNILQIVVFSLFAGFGLAQLGTAGDGLRKGVQQLGSLMLVITQKIMLLAPLAVFCAVADTLSRQGMGLIASLAWLVAGYYIALAVLFTVLAITAFLLAGKASLGLARAIREPALVAFSTSSSEAAYPRLLAALEGFGFRKDLVSLVLPLGYSFNLDASITYCAFASVFLLDVHDIYLAPNQFTMLMLMLFLASKGIAAVPRGSLLALAAVLPQFGVPASSLALLLAVDHLLNMGRSGLNVLGNSVAVLAVSRWEQGKGARAEATLTPARAAGGEL